MDAAYGKLQPCSIRARLRLLPCFFHCPVLQASSSRFTSDIGVRGSLASTHLHTAHRAGSRVILRATPRCMQHDPSKRGAHTGAAFLVGLAPALGGDAPRVGDGSRGAGDSPCPPRRRMAEVWPARLASRCAPRDPVRRPVADTSDADATAAIGDSIATISEHARPHRRSSTVLRGMSEQRLCAALEQLQEPQGKRRRCGRRKAPALPAKAVNR